MANVTDLIKTSKRVVPMIYAYTTPGITYHNGYIKIGYTEQDVDQRIKEQTHTAGIKAKKEWQGNATYEDGTAETFKDDDFHAYLRRWGYKQPQDEGNEYFDPNDRNEWFHISPSDSLAKFTNFRMHRGLNDTQEVIPYTLRAEQEKAVNDTESYFLTHENPEFLWNAKPRFGKTLTAYDLMKRLKAEKVLIVTNRPAIANSWYDDYARFIGRQGGYFFVSRVEGVLGKPLTISYSQYDKDAKSREIGSSTKMGLIEFVSLQDLKGSNLFGGNEGNKLQEVAAITWDLLIIDEAHEGVDTYKTDIAFNRIGRKYTLHLSGTPFKALASYKFHDNAIYNWTYADEQSSKKNWTGPADNPYETLPKLNMFTYQMSEIIKDEISEGIEIDGKTEEYAFDLNEFFATDDGRFKHNSSVDKFLDALTTQEKYPFSTPELRNELKHTFWLLDRVDSATALARKLEKHPVFKEYKIILAAGNGRLDDQEETKRSYDKVVDAIQNYDKTITLSVGQLTTGVTIPEWTGVLMLSNIKSPSLYMQAAFRAQNPCLFNNGVEKLRKENAYVFDFDPARTLVIFEQFANDLMKDTAAGHGDSETRKKHVRELLNFFPVIGEDDNGEMIELDAEKVLSIPRKIKSQEVVKRGFMSDFLFQNIVNVFRAPSVVIDILNKFKPVKEPKPIAEENLKDVPLDSNGNVSIDNEIIIGQTTKVFGDKVFTNIQEDIAPVIEVAKTEPETLDNKVMELKNDITENFVTNMVQMAKDFYNDDLKQSTANQISKQLKNDIEHKVNVAVDNYKIETRILEDQKAKALDNLLTSGKTQEEVENEFLQKNKEALDKLNTNLQTSISNFITEAKETTVQIVETKKKEKEMDKNEATIRDHLRGFSRTIPAFLMAYGENEVTLSTFDKIIPDNVFLEVTSITIEQFKFLRDGGDYEETETGEIKHFDGNLFEPIVFDDSVKEFMRKKKELANYFDENSKEDIFRYIPPQKTNQIFTPRKVVADMVDMLEKENPGCFDDSTKTFADLYMKSGMYISEIVKRLYRSEKLKKEFPDQKERLNHIFAKQVYGCAPTEIIYRICMSYLLGFSNEIQINKHNIILCDTLEYAKNGTLEQELTKRFQFDN